MADALEARGSISLLLGDVDGTLVTEDKLLIERARAAVHRLHEAGSSRRSRNRPPTNLPSSFRSNGRREIADAALSALGLMTQAPTVMPGSDR